MKLNEIFTQLSCGELSQLSIGGGNAGEIKEPDYAKVIAHINLGLTALYTRFPLKEGEHILPLQEGVRTYNVTAEDILKIERVFDKDGCEWALNNEANARACRVLSPTVLQIPAELLAVGGDLRIGYRANHPMLVSNYGCLNPEETLVELPYSHLQALLFFVASRFHNPVGMTNEFHAGNSYYAKYEAECLRLEEEGLYTNQGGEYNRIVANGWV